MLQQAWQRRGWLACALWPLSLLYRLIASLHRFAFQRGLLRVTRVGVPVVVVGNVLVGGTGKTPVLIAIARHLQARGLQVGVVSRGYAGTASDCREVLPDSDPALVGDEPLLIARSINAPVFVATRRVQAAQALLARHPVTRLILCDDGLQHYALAREVEICLFDDRGIGNGWCLPAGPLREAWPRAVDFVLHTGLSPLTGGFRAHRGLAAHALRSDGRKVSLATLVGTPVHAVAAIARPDAFFAMLRSAGLELARTTALPDHYSFASWHAPDAQNLTLVCTEKDAVKLWRSHPSALAVLLEVSIDQAFFVALEEHLGLSSN